MKLILRTIILAAVLAVFGGCQLVKAPTWYTHSWLGLTYRDAKQALNDSKNAMLVCITEDHAEQGEEEFGGIKRPGQYFQHYKATVARSYKGDCQPADRVAFVIEYCSCGGKREVRTNAFVGDLLFVLAEGPVRTNAEFGVTFMGCQPYDPETERLFVHLFGAHQTQPRGSQQAGCTKPRDHGAVPSRGSVARSP